MTRRCTPASAEAFFAMRAKVGPIFPPTPMTTMSPPRLPSVRIAPSVGSLRRSSSCATSRIEAGLACMVPTNFLMVILSLASDCTRIIHRPSSGFGYSYRPVYNSPGDFLRMHLRVMTEQDIPVGLRLNTLSGWNQTAVDWHRFLDNSPGGCFVMEHDSKVVGTATTISYENRFAWIGMVLVDPEYRTRGIGTQLLRKTVEYLDQRCIPTMKLDATPLGKPLYQKLGFVPEFEIERLVLKRTSEAASATLGSICTQVGKVEMEQVVGMDREVFGAN